MNASDVALIACALNRSRPANIFQNALVRKQWYADVSAIAETLKREGFSPAELSNFFDVCGVPT